MSSRDYQQVEMLRQLKQLALGGEPPGAHRVAASASLDEAIKDEAFAKDLRSLTITPTPRGREVSASERLNEAMGKEHVRGRRFRMVAAVAAVFAVAVSLTAVSLFMRAQPVTALGSIAEAVAVLPADEFADTQLERHTQEERLVVSAIDETPIPAVQPVTRVDRIDTDGRIERTETFGEPRLLNPQDAPHLDRVRTELAAGTTVTNVFDAPRSDETMILADSAETLSNAMRNQYDRWGDPTVPYQAYTLDRITSIYLTTVPTPQQRAAILTSLDAIPSLAQTEPNGGATVTYQHVGAAGRELRELHFDNDGWLTEASLTLIDGSDTDRIPPGTRTRIRLAAPSPVD